MLATAALLVLAATAEAATSKNYYGGRESYKHKDHDSPEPSYDLHGVYGSEYMRSYDHGHEAYETKDYHHEPLYESHFADRSYREPHHDSYDEGYGGDSYSEELTYTYESKQPSYEQSTYRRSKRSERDGQFRRRHAVARATFTEQGVSGTIQFEQRAPSHAVWTCIKLSGLGGKAGMFHVHEFAVKENNCSSTGGHFNPFNVDASLSPSAGTGMVRAVMPCMRLATSAASMEAWRARMRSAIASGTQTSASLGSVPLSTGRL